MEKNKLISKMEIIAEIANAHQGDPVQAYKLATASCLAGADAVKFQVYFAEELVTLNHPRFNHFKNQSFSSNTWNKIIQKLKKKKIKIYCDVFGEKAFKVAKANKVDGYKIHSSDLNNLSLLNLVKKTRKKIFLSTGGSTLEEINYAVKIFKNEKKVPILLHGFQSYPTKVENCDLSRIKLFKKIFQNHCEYGYQDHISGDDPLNLTTPLIAMGMGANYLEKHVTLDRSKKGIDYYSSLEPKELSKFVKLVRNSEKSIGKNSMFFCEDEKKYRNEIKKIWFSKKKLKKNIFLKKSDLIMKRPFDSEINPVNLEDLIGRKILNNINFDQAIKKSDLATYRGSRHKKKLPVRRQRTHFNARTRKGKTIAIAGKKLTPLKK